MGAYADRDALLKKMGFADYAAYRASDLWKGIRGQVRIRDKCSCRVCGTRTGIVHHDSYGERTLKGETLDSLYSLCDRHHRDVEFNGEQKRCFSEVRSRLRELLPCVPPLRTKKKKRHRADRQRKKKQPKVGKKRSVVEILERAKVAAIGTGAFIAGQLVSERHAWTKSHGAEPMPKYLKMGNLRNDRPFLPKGHPLSNSGYPVCAEKPKSPTILRRERIRARAEQMRREMPGRYRHIAIAIRDAERQIYSEDRKQSA